MAAPEKITRDWLLRIRKDAADLYFRFEVLTPDQVDDLINDIDICVTELKKKSKEKRDKNGEEQL
jgi:hypothetical protein